MEPSVSVLATQVSDLQMQIKELGYLKQSYQELERQLQTMQTAGSLEPISAIAGWQESSPHVTATGTPAQFTTPPVATFVGQAQLLLAGSGVTLERIDNTPYLRITASGGGMNADYIVSSDGTGTHLKLFGVGGALSDAAIAINAGPSNTSKFIWVCATHVESVSGTTTLAAMNQGGVTDQHIVVASGGDNHPRFTIDAATTANLIKVDSGDSTSSIRFESMGFLLNGIGTSNFITTATGGGRVPRIRLRNVVLSSAGATWQYIIEGGGVAVSGVEYDDLTYAGYALEHENGTSSGTLNAFVVHNSDITVTRLIDHGASTGVVDPAQFMHFTGNRLLVSDYGMRVCNTTEEFVFTGNQIEHTGNTDFFLMSTAVFKPYDLVINDNHYDGSSGGNSTRFFRNANIVGTITNLSIVGNTLIGPGGTSKAIEMTGAAAITSVVINGYRSWGTNVSGAGAMTTFEGPVTFTGAVSFTAAVPGVLLQNGTTPLTANWNPGAFTIGNFDYSSKPAVAYAGDANFFRSLVASGTAIVDGRDAKDIGTTVVTAPAGHPTYATKATLTGGIYTSMRAWVASLTVAHDAIMAIYTDSAGSPGALVASTNIVTIGTSMSHVTFSFATAQTIGAGTYWLAIGLTPSANNWNIRAAIVGANAGSHDGENATYSTWPAAYSTLAGTLGTTAYSLSIIGSAALNPTITFDTDDMFWYLRTSNLFGWEIGLIDQMYLDTNGLRVASTLYVGALTAPANTTTGDASFLRAVIGADAAISAGVVGLINGGLDYTNIALPAAPSAATVRMFGFTRATGVYQDTVRFIDTNSHDSGTVMRAHSLIPFPLSPSTGAPAGVVLPSSAATGFAGMVVLTAPMTLHSISYNVTAAAVGAGQVVRLAVYSEAKVLITGTNVTDAVGTGTGVQTKALASDVFLPAGNYYVFICSQTNAATTNATVATYTADATYDGVTDILGGTVVVAAGAAPSPLGTVTATANRIPYLKFNGAAT